MGESLEGNRNEFIVELGTGFLDVLLDCEDITAFDVNAYALKRQPKRRSVALDAHVHHATKEDEQVFRKIAKWQVEEETINMNYKKFHQNLVTAIVEKLPKNRVKKPFYFEDDEEQPNQSVEGNEEQQQGLQRKDDRDPDSDSD